MRKPELLSPAGNLTKLKIALAYGADAVYASVAKLSAVQMRRTKVRRSASQAQFSRNSSARRRQNYFLPSELISASISSSLIRLSVLSPSK